MSNSEKHKGIELLAFRRWERRGGSDGRDWADWFDAERQIDRYFYHSFPRLGRGTEFEIEVGLQILKSFVLNGLLLTPEINYLSEEIVRPTSIKDQRIRVTSTIVQQRACLTELHPSELLSHSTEFGAFALEFEIASARQLGAMPVLYYNNDDPHDGGSWYAKMLLARLTFLRDSVLPKLSDLLRATEQKASDQEAAVCVFEDGTVLTARMANNLFRMVFGDPNRPDVGLIYKPDDLDKAIRLTANLWGPTENPKYNDLMHYFRQREWRIVNGLQRTGLEFNEPTEEQVDYLIQSNAAYFGKQIQYPKGMFQRARGCVFLKVIDGAHFLRHVNRIIVPEAAISSAEQILGVLPFGVKITSFESTWTN